MEWWGRYIGAPFGNGPGHFTCWSLIRSIYADQLGIELPRYGELAASYVAAVERLRTRSHRDIPEDMLRARSAVSDALAAGQAADCWQQVTLPVQFDVCLMKRHKPGDLRIGHVGIAVDNNRMLHVERTTGAVVVPMAHPSVFPRTVGFRRHVMVK